MYKILNWDKEHNNNNKQEWLFLACPLLATFDLVYIESNGTSLSMQ